MSTREQISVALARGFGAGSTKLQAMARDALAQANVGANPDPRRIATGLRFGIHEMTASEVRAIVDGRVLSYRWDPSKREWGLNLFIAIATALLAEVEGTPGHAEVYALAGFLAMPENTFDTAGEMARQEFLPEWFIAAHQRFRSVGSASGVLRLVAR